MSNLSDHRKDQIEMHRSVAGMYRRREGYPFSVEFQQERNELLFSLLPERDEGWALDLGCGTGIMLDQLARRFPRVGGLDLSQEMLLGFEASEQARGSSVLLIRGDMTTLPLKSDGFDAVLCRSALHHMDDEVAVLSEICRVLKPDGRLILGEPANDNPLFRLARWFVKRRPSFGRIHTIDRAYTRGQLRDLLNRSGLEVSREVRFGFIAYTFCDNPELVPVLKWMPSGLATQVGRGLRVLDRILSHIPLIRLLSWYTMLEVRRQGPSRS